MTDRANLTDLISELTIAITRYQEETRQNFFEMGQRITRLEAARTDIPSRMKTWMASLSLATTGIKIAVGIWRALMVLGIPSAIFETVRYLIRLMWTS